MYYRYSGFSKICNKKTLNGKRRELYFGGSSNHLSRAPNEGAVFSDLYARTKYLSEIHESQTITLCAELRAPNEGAVFSDLYARTKYLSEIYMKAKLLLCVQSYLFVIRLDSK